MDDIYEHLKKGVRKQKNKTAIFLCGASGSGKTSNRKTILDKIKFQKSYVSINLDDIIALNKSPDNARKIVVDLFERTINDGYSILYDGTCRYPPFVKDKINQLKNNNYKIVLVINYAKLETVIERVKQRKHQLTPISIVKNIYSEISKKADEYMNMKDIDELYLFSNENERTKMVFSRVEKKIHCISPDDNFYFDVSQYC